jgi:S-adenosylmethionine-dependent methyltransferase
MIEDSTPGSSTCPALASPRTSHTTRPSFDAHAQDWEAYTATVLGRLRQDLTLHHLMVHLGPSPGHLQVLDAGGGTGGYALPLAEQGHQVCLLDFAPGMLAIARGKAEGRDPSLLERLTFRCAPVEEVPKLFAPGHFDLILCHTLLEYVAEPREVLQILAVVLRAGGLISLLCVNPHADALRWALARGDLERARLALSEGVSGADLFGLPRRTMPAEGVRQAMAQAGLDEVATHGVRIFADYQPSEKLADPAFLEQLTALELAASGLEPYRSIARYIQLIGVKPEI